MTGKNHLGTTSEMLEYLTAMNNELIKHKKEKSSMREWGFNQSMRHCINEMNKRTKEIKRCFEKVTSFDEFNEDTRIQLYEIIIKQYVHIGNFSMMGYLKAKENI